MLTRSDLDQCVRYLADARDQLARTQFVWKAAAAAEIDMCMVRLGPGDQKTLGSHIAGAIKSLNGIAEKMPAGDMRVTLNKAIAVLRDRTGRTRYRA